MKKTISVIIVTYKSENHIYDCIDSIFRYNDIGSALEVIVVDNNSPEVDQMFTKIISIYGDEIVLLKNRKNGGYGQGNNIGIKRAKSDIVMIVNPDVRFYQSVFCSILNAFKDRSVAFVGFQQMTEKITKRQSYLLISLCFFSLLYYKISSFFNYFDQRLMCLSGACFACRKDIFENIGMFDESLFLYGEELDLHTRLFNYSTSLNVLFLKSIGYIHLMDNRPLSLKTAELQLASFLYLCDKYKWDKKKKIKELLNYYRMLKYRSLLLGEKKKLIWNQIIKMTKDSMPK